MTQPIDDKTSLTDDERIENIVPLPPPEHLIRFFPIQGTPVEALVTDTRAQAAPDPARHVRPPAGGHRAVLDPRPGRRAGVREEAGVRNASSTPTSWRS